LYAGGRGERKKEKGGKRKFLPLKFFSFDLGGGGKEKKKEEKKRTTFTGFRQVSVSICEGSVRKEKEEKKKKKKNAFRLSAGNQHTPKALDNEGREGKEEENSGVFL